MMKKIICLLVCLKSKMVNKHTKNFTLVFESKHKFSRASLFGKKSAIIHNKLVFNSIISIRSAFCQLT